jgi:hypothetical protein
MKITKRQLRRIIKEALIKENGPGAALVDELWSNNRARADQDQDFYDELEYASNKIRKEFSYEDDPEGNEWTPETMQAYADEIQSDLLGGEFYGK